MNYDKALIMTIAGAYRRGGYDKSSALKVAWYQVKKTTYREAFVAEITSYVSQSENKDYRLTYNNIYTIIKNEYGVDVFAIPENSKLKKIDLVCNANLEEVAYKIATEYIKLSA